MPCRHARRGRRRREGRSGKGKPTRWVTDPPPVTLLSQDHDTRFGRGPSHERAVPYAFRRHSNAIPACRRGSSNCPAESAGRTVREAHSIPIPGRGAAADPAQEIHASGTEGPYAPCRGGRPHQHPGGSPAADAAAGARDATSEGASEHGDADGTGDGAARPDQGARPGDHRLADHHRPQEDRASVPDHVVRVLPGRRGDGAGDARRAGPAGAPAGEQPRVQSAVHAARHDHAAAVRDPHLRGLRQRTDAPADRRPRRRLPAAEHAVVLAVPVRRADRAAPCWCRTGRPPSAGSPTRR
ncbi:hypothetical protein SGLAM104S_00949 [Streptomyces glaucescens]